MEKIIYLFVLLIFVIGCNKPEDDILNDTNSIITFLEKFEGTVWLKDNPKQVLFLRFINRTETPLEYWIKDISCYHYTLERIYDDTTLAINLENVLEFRYYRNIDATDYINIITIEVFDNIMLLESKHYEDDILVSIENLNYDKSIEDVDKLPLCELTKVSPLFKNLSLINQ